MGEKGDSAFDCSQDDKYRNTQHSTFLLLDGRDL